MTVDGDIHWFRFLSRWALFAGLAELGLILLSILWMPPASQASSLPEQYGELAEAIANPTFYRLDVLLDMAVWLGLGGFFIALAVILLPRAPIRGVLLAACGVGQLLGVLGTFVRLDIIGVAERYVRANHDQASLLSSYRDLQAVIGSHFDAGALLWSVAFVLVAWAGLAMTEFPRWLVVLVGLTGVVGMIDMVLYFVTGDFHLEFLKFSLILIVFFAVAWAFWRGPRSRDRREASPRVGRLGDSTP
jgi:hypothetical protein